MGEGGGLARKVATTVYAVTVKIWTAGRQDRAWWRSKQPLAESVGDMATGRACTAAVESLHGETKGFNANMGPSPAD